MTIEATPREQEETDRMWLKYSHADSDCNTIYEALVHTFSLLDAEREHKCHPTQAS